MSQQIPHLICPNQTKVKQLSLSFASAKTLCSRMDDLPKAPAWKTQEISLNGYQTVKPLVLFYHDALECVPALLQNPMFEGKWTFAA